ncbi:hypothetical protein LINGRAHAP2_LOCUS31191 [Linum grandiflorum]
MAIYAYIAPVRSISLPSRIHPTSLKFQATLTKLKSWESSSSSCSTSQTRQPIQGHHIETGLTRLEELFHRVEQVLQSPLARNSLEHHQHQEVEDALDGSVRLLDVCNIAKELVQSMKEHVNGVQSALRRRNSTSIHDNIQAYFTFRKKARKSMSTSLRLLSKKSNLSSASNSLVIQSTREASSVAASVFESFFMFISSPYSVRGSWAVVKSKLVRSREPVSSLVKNEVESLDAALCSFTKFDVQEVQRRLEGLDGCFQGIEAKLDCVFRCMIQNRVSLLNLVTPS